MNTDERKSEELAVAEDIAREAGRLLEGYFSSGHVDTRQKGARDVVTQADLASESLIRRRLELRFPDDGIQGEEGATAASRSGREWLIDPLDGTLNYSRGVPIWCVSLALFQKGQPILGAIDDPLSSETFTAAEQSGAWLNGRPLHTSQLTLLQDALVHLTVDFHDLALTQGLEDIRLVAPRVLRTRNIGSAALALAYVAGGRLDAMMHRFAHAWDYGAGALLIREAGGVVNSLDPGTYTADSPSILGAATEKLASQLAEVVRPGEPPR